jgi:transposase
VEDEEMDSTVAAGMPKQEVEVLAQAARRRFTREYKRAILKEADRCRKPGELGALLRREGLYSSHISAWRAARDRGELGGRGSRKRGPEAKALDKSAKRIAELERENRRLRKRAERAEALVDVQKKLSELLESAAPPSDERS